MFRITLEIGVDRSYHVKGRGKNDVPIYSLTSYMEIVKLSFRLVDSCLHCCTHERNASQFNNRFKLSY